VIFFLVCNTTFSLRNLQPKDLSVPLAFPSCKSVIIIPFKCKHSDPQFVKHWECLILADKIDLLDDEMFIPCNLCLLLQACQKNGDPEIVCKINPRYSCCRECVQ